MWTRYPLTRKTTPALLLCLAMLAGCDSGGSANSEPPADPPTQPEAQPTVTAEPTPEAKPELPGVAVVAERLPYAEVGEQLVYGHFVFPADMIDPLPAVILFHGSWGLDDQVRARADRLAAEGYIVLAVDLFDGATAMSPEEARQQMLRVVENSAAARDNIRQAYEFVHDTAAAPRVGSVGWDFGGGWALTSAMLFPDALDAAVVVYGQVTDQADDLEPVGAPILGLFAELDRTVNVASVRRFETTLESLGKNYEIHIYPGTEHFFADTTSAAYSQETAADAWQKMLDFLELHLKIDESESP